MNKKVEAKIKELYNCIYIKQIGDGKYYVCKVDEAKAIISDCNLDELRLIDKEICKGETVDANLFRALDKAKKHEEIQERHKVANIYRTLNHFVGPTIEKMIKKLESELEPVVIPQTKARKKMK